MTGCKSSINPARVDYHCHLLPGLDDGSRHLEDSLAMARLLVRAGFDQVYCTPHCMRGVYETTPVQLKAALSSLQSQLDQSAIPLMLRPGMEYYLDEYFPRLLETPVPLGDTKLLLVEAPHQGHPQLVQENIFHAVRQGFTPLFAHPERVSFLTLPSKKRGLFHQLQAKWGRLPAASSFSEEESLLTLLRQQGCCFQGNLGSFAGFYGREVQKKAQLFKSAGLYDFYGSDGHRPQALSEYLTKGLELVS